MSQTNQILSHLKRGWSITALDALKKYGCFRLAARIRDIRDMGYPVETVLEYKHGKKYARYRMNRK
jgi:hypothetical protein